jgi:hypothetical protein
LKFSQLTGNLFRCKYRNKTVHAKLKYQVGSDERGGGKSGGYENYYQTNKGRLLGIGGILIIVGLVLYFARHQEAVLILVIVGVVLFIAGVIYKPHKKKEIITEESADEKSD